MWQALAASGVDAVNAGVGDTLLLFDRANSDVMAALRERRSTGRVLALSLGSEPLSPDLPWALLESGAADVLHAHSAPSAAPVVAARLRRWHDVDEVLASAVVREHLVGGSAAWRCLLRQVVEIACFGNGSLLVTGESGTGKELVARLVHTLDRRAGKRELVVVDCGALHAELTGSEFFGHERGAYTGAAGSRDGAFAMADRGTLFLDEVGELPMALQPQLLRVIQERSFKRLGGSQWQRSEFRLVCATHRDLEQGVAQGSFRGDLFHRVSACRVHMPPLRERREDIPALASHFLAELGAAPGFDPAVLHWLQHRDWPGNVRELRQVVGRLAARHVGEGPISVGDVPQAERPQAMVSRDWRGPAFDAVIASALDEGAALREIGQHATETAIRLALAACGGNLPRAARRLGVTDRALQLRRAGRQAGSPAQVAPVTPSEPSFMP